MLSHTIPESVANLERLGISRADAFTLRRIAMTLHRWHELECGTDRGCIERDQKWAIERCAWPASDRLRWWNGSDWARKLDRRTYDDWDKTKIMEGLPTTRQWDSADFARANAQGFPSQGAWRDTGSKPHWRYSDGRLGSVIADREAGALRRLARVMASYPHLSAYVQTDPRGASLYILDKATTPQPYDQFYNRGVAVYK